MEGKQREVGRGILRRKWRKKETTADFSAETHYQIRLESTTPEVDAINRREIPPLCKPTPSQERRRRKCIGSLRLIG
jgi:hypothetical protein